MTELETLKRAKMYMDQLAIGVNPIDNTEVPENDVANNPRLLKCFSYISGVLAKLIKNEEKRSFKSNQAQKSPFAISQEQIKKYDISKTPIFLSEITERFNNLIDQKSIKKLSTRDLSKWLVEVQLVDEIHFDEAKAPIRKPTQLGTEIGIISEKRISQKGSEYSVLLFSESAQRFIVDNIGCIIDFSLESHEEDAENNGKPWDKEQEDKLIQLYKDGKSIKEIADIFKRTSGGVKSRLKKLGMLKY